MFLTEITLAQTPIQEWAARYDHSGNTDVFLDMVQDNVGNTYVCGYSDDPATGTDIVVAKFELDGDTAWIYRYNDSQTNGEDKAVAIALTSNDDVVVAGSSERQGTAKDFITILISGTSGTAMSGWPQFVDGADHGDDWANDVTVRRQSDNLIAVCGAYTQGQLRKGLITYETNGNTNWIGNQNNNSNYDTYNLFCGFINTGNLVIIDQSHGYNQDTISHYYVINGTSGAYLNSSTGAEMGYVYPYESSQNIVRAFVVDGTKAYVLVDYYNDFQPYEDYFAIYELDGGNPGSYSIDPIIVKAYDQRGGRATGITVNSSKIYVSGYEDMNPLSGIDWNGYVSVFNKGDHSQIWYENYGGSEDTRFLDIAIDNLSNAYVTGFTTVGGNRNIVTAKFTPTGSLDWDIQYNGTGNGVDEAYRIAVGSGNTTGSIWVAGKSNGTQDDGIVIKYCVPPVAVAGSDKEYCTGGSAQLGGSSTGGYTYEWTPPTGLSDPAISNPMVSLTNTTDCPEVHQYILKVTNGNGCSNYDTVQVEVFHAPSVSIVTSQPNVICENESPIIITPTIDIGCEGTPIYSWKQDGNLAQAPNNLSNPYSVSDESQSGNYTLTVTNNYGATSCATTSNSVSATVNPIPVGSATPSTSAICVDGTTSIQLGSSISGTTYGWTGSGAGSANGSGSTISQTLNTAGSAIYTITPTVTATGCVGNSFNATVTVNPLPTAPTITASGPTEFCDGGSVTLTSSAASSYSWSPTEGISISANADATGAYTVTITDANGCENTSAAMQVTVNDNPVADAGSDKTFCAGFADFLGGNPTANGGQGPYTYTWSNSSNLDDGTAANPSVLTTLSSGNYNFSINVVDGNGCIGADQVLITVLDELVADAGSDTTVCFGDSVSLSGSGGNSYLWSPTSGLDVSNIPDPMASPNDTTEYRLIVSANGCANDTAWVMVNVNPLPDQPTVTVSGLDITCNESGYSYQWNLDGNILNGETDQTLVNADQSGDYTLTITDANGCSDTSSAVMPVGILDMAMNLIKLYPNPNTGQFFIQNGEKALRDAQLTIMDMLGKVVHTETISRLAEGGRKAFDLKLKPGVYILSLSDADFRSVQRLIIE